MEEEASTITETETAEEIVTAPPVEPPQEPTKPLYTCGHCGAKVVPEEHDTPTGKVNRCPNCGKFMKLETPEEVRERQKEEKGPLPPPEIMLTDRVKELLSENLPKVYGIPKKEATKTIAAILDTLNPEAASDPWNLHNHVKNFAPNADDRHLESIIKKIFGQLELEGYVKAGKEHRPSYRERTTERGYRPTYARGQRDYGEDYGEDYEGRGGGLRIVVDGQQVETDYRGYLAHQTWKREQAEEKRRADEHDLRMKKVEAEILKISAETGGSKTYDEAEEKRRDEEHELRMKRLEAEILKITGETKDSKTPSGPYDEAEEKRRAEEHELRMKRLEAEILKITRETEGSRSPAGPHEEVREFLDADGNLCDPEKAVSVRIKRIPIETSKGLTAEEVRSIMREEKEELTPDKVREIIRTESGRGESEEVKTLKTELGEQRKTIEGLKGTIESKDKQVLLDKVEDLEERIKDISSMGAGDFKSDEMRLIKGGISDIKDLLQTYLKGERPLDRAERLLTGGPQTAGTKPSSEMAGEAERGGVIQELRKHGLVTRILERK